MLVAFIVLCLQTGGDEPSRRVDTLRHGDVIGVGFGRDTEAFQNGKRVRMRGIEVGVVQHHAIGGQRDAKANPLQVIQRDAALGDRAADEVVEVGVGRALPQVIDGLHVDVRESGAGHPQGDGEGAVFVLGHVPLVVGLLP
ncbi:MAG: hypothetical protein CL610_15320 [Anaerolineaceae bacterium]|nr:hypothetical protein [Anaerolineaceae bacterium]